MELSRTLYVASQGPTVDRPKPVRKSEVLVINNNCSAIDAEWQCMPYALSNCESLRGTDEYLQCLDDRFHACRRGAGCDYRYNTSPSICTPSPNKDLQFRNAIQTVCNAPNREYASRESYQACVERMSEWSEQGCTAIEPNEISGHVLNSSGW